MAKQSTDHLIQLIRSLTKAEKRNLRLFVNRNTQNEEKLFMQLFDHLDKKKVYNETHILAQIPKIKRRQLPNIKANLYKQILNSLRQLERNNQLDIAIRENLDFAKILYTKGLYKASLDLLDKSKKLAFANNYYSNALTVVEFEKHIESQYVTGSMYPKAEEIINETDFLMKKLALTHQLTNLSISLYGLYLKYGHTKNQKDHDFIEKYFKANLPDVSDQNLDFYQKTYLYQSYVWYNYMTKDFINNYKYAQKWVDLFHERPEMISLELPTYLKGLHNVLSALFMIQRYDRFITHFEVLRDFNADGKISMNQNEKSLHSLYTAIHDIHRFFLAGDYDDAVKTMPPLEAILEINEYNWDEHRMMVFNYKVACIYFGYGDLDKTISLLNRVTNQIYPDLREDIQCYSRILNLIAHYDLGNATLVSYQIKNVYRFLLKMEHLQDVLKEILAFLRKTPSIEERNIRAEFTKLRDSLLTYDNDFHERKPFMYLDIISWLESKIENRPIKDIIKEKMTRKIAKLNGSYS